MTLNLAAVFHLAELGAIAGVVILIAVVPWLVGHVVAAIAMYVGAAA